MSNRQKLMGHLYAIFTTLVWGSCFVLTKVMLTAYTPTQIIPLRMGLAYLALWALRPKTMKLPWKDELMFILIGITGGSFYFFLQNTASAHTSAANVSILVSMSPILTVILAQLFSRRGEKLGKWVYIGAVVAIAGVVMVVLNGTLSFHLSPLGDLLALAAALMWAVYSILVKKYTERYDNFLVTRRVFLWAFLTSLPLVLLTDGLPSLTPLFTQPNILVSWLFLGVFGNAVCFAIWNIAFKRLGVVITNNYLYATPFVTVVAGWLLLGEKISLMCIIGAVLITLGVIFAGRSDSGVSSLFTFFSIEGRPSGRPSSACQKSLAEFAARRRQRSRIIFSCGICVRENTSQAASVEFVRLWHTNYARSRLQAFCRKNPEDFSDSLERDARQGVPLFVSAASFTLPERRMPFRSVQNRQWICRSSCAFYRIPL